MPREFRADIQALRGIAVLLVVIYHANVGLFPAGYLGVDIFFVISGFLITGLIKTHLEEGRFSFREFYYRRAKRLLPAAYTVIALTTIAAPFFLSDIGLQEFKFQVLGAITFTGNIALWLQSDYFAQAAETKPLLHVWSLAIEEQYYLLLPAFLLATPARLWLRVVGLLLVISLALCLYLASQEPSATFYLLPTRFWEMAIGSVGALLPPHHLLRTRCSWLRLPALATLLFIPVYPFGGAHPGIDALLVSLATLTLLLARTRNNGAVWPLVKIGDISYSLYLIHWPALVYVRAAWLTEPPALAIYSALAFSLGASWALYQFVEEPFRQNPYSSRKRLTSGLIATSVLLGLAPSIVIAATERDIDFKMIRRSNLGLGNTCAFKPGFPPQDIPATCKTVDKPQLLVWGDSYAMAIVPGIAKTIGDYGVAQLTMSACGPAVGAAPFEKRVNPRYTRDFAESCIRFNESVLSILKKQPEIKIVAISSPFAPFLANNNLMLVQHGNSFKETKTSTDLAVQGIKTLVEAVRAAGKKVVVVGPMPNIGIDIGECLERKAQGRVILGEYKDCQIPAPTLRKLRAPVLQMLRQVSVEANVEVVSPYDALCSETICRTELNGKPLYRDEGHLSYEGSEAFFLVTGLTKKMIRAAR